MSPFDHLGENMMSRKCIFPRKARHPQGLAVSSFAAGKMRKWRSIELITRFHPSYRVGWYGPMRKLLAIYIGLIHSVAVNLEIPAQSTWGPTAQDSGHYHLVGIVADVLSTLRLRWSSVSRCWSNVDRTYERLSQGISRGIRWDYAYAESMFSIPVTSFRGQHRAGHERVTSVWYGIKIGRVSSPYFNAYRLVTSDPEPGMRLSRAHLHDGAAGADPATRGAGGTRRFT